MAQRDKTRLLYTDNFCSPQIRALETLKKAGIGRLGFFNCCCVPNVRKGSLHL
jgi:hypothetical protein